MVSEMYTSKRSAYSRVLSHHNWTSCIASSFLGPFNDILGSLQKAICGQIKTTLDVQQCTAASANAALAERSVNASKTITTDPVRSERFIPLLGAILREGIAIVPFSMR
ncbi:unnamed protein product [Albugo candida]|uniref:Uncharacterized protein n=1 Tax=Albugo candida TaxID=65357 RepID=A0A024FXL1_9STRA|nr:unnamed protein product [Albugo candida]|eukprot:CCI11766.1 unnamed protein product [Albugo candida]